VTRIPEGRRPRCCSPKAAKASAVGSQGRHRFLRLLAVVGCLLISQGSAPRRLSPPSRNLSRLTYDPGLQCEPTWSPDGRFIAYSSDRAGNFDIWVKPWEGTRSRSRRSDPDWQPDWSPDGNLLVFRSERGGGGLFIVPVLGGAERKVVDFGYRPRWSPAGTEVLFSSSALKEASLWDRAYLTSLDGKPPQQILAEFAAVYYATWHPDGKRVTLLGRHGSLGRGLWTVPMTGGTPRKMESSPDVARLLEELGINLNYASSLLWGPSGRDLYFVAGSRGVQNIWKVSVDPQTLSLVAGPERLTTGPGEDSDIAITRDGKRLSFTTRVKNDRIWSLPFDASSGRLQGDGQAITESGKRADVPDLSPDGKKIAFHIVRGDKEELWEKSLETNIETLLIPSDGLERFVPRWSRDGMWLAYRRTRYLNPEQTRSERPIVLLDARGGVEQQLTSPESGINDIAYDWSKDGKWILGSSNRVEHGRDRSVQVFPRHRLCLFPVAAAPSAEKEMRVISEHPEQSMWQGRFSPDDRWIIFNASTMDEPLSVIYVIPASGGPWILVTDETYWADKGRWAPDGRTIYFISNRLTGFFNVWGVRFDPAKGKPEGEPFRVTRLESPGRMILPVVGSLELGVSARRLILPVSEVNGNIWVLEDVGR
jgi:Tol biopolymer transport system component